MVAFTERIQPDPHESQSKAVEEYWKINRARFQAALEAEIDYLREQKWIGAYIHPGRISYLQTHQHWLATFPPASLEQSRPFYEEMLLRVQARQNGHDT